MARGIYKIINLVNNKFYIGSSVNLKRRRIAHFAALRHNRHRNAHLQAAWNKYGESSFVFAVVEEVPEDTDLLAVEDSWLEAHVGTPHCYNLGTTAVAPMLGRSGPRSPNWGKFGPLSPNWGYRHTDEAKARIAAASRGRPVRAEVRELVRVRLLGKPRPEAVRAKISAALSGENGYWYGKERPDHGIKVSRAVRLTSPLSDVVEYPSIKALRLATGLMPITVSRALKKSSVLPSSQYAGWTVAYVDAQPVRMREETAPRAPRSEETKARISAAQRGVAKPKGRKVSEEGRAKIRANIEAGRSHKHWTGRRHNDAAKAKLSKPVLVLPDNIQFPSLTAVLEHYGIFMTTLRRALASGKPIAKGPLAGKSFQYILVDAAIPPCYKERIPVLDAPTTGRTDDMQTGAS